MAPGSGSPQLEAASVKQIDTQVSAVGTARAPKGYPQSPGASRMVSRGQMRAAGMAPLPPFCPMVFLGLLRQLSS